jgi:hypothetical protein
MPNARKTKGYIPVVNLNPEQELSAEQIVQVANGEVQIFSEGDKAGITLPHKHRALFMAAIALGYLKYSRQQTRVAEGLPPSANDACSYTAAGVQREHTELTYQDLAGLGHVSASRLTQILNLLHLAPDLQERLLWLEPNRKGRDRIHERALRRLPKLYDWRQQRLAFEALLAAAGGPTKRQEGNGGPHA